MATRPQFTKALSDALNASDAAVTLLDTLTGELCNDVDLAALPSGVANDFKQVLAALGAAHKLVERFTLTLADLLLDEVT